MLHKDEQVLDVLKQLKNHLFDFAILGGYPRDLHHGRNPKDMDVCIFNFHSYDNAECVLLDKLIHKLTFAGLIDSIYSKVSAEGDSRVYTTIKLTCGMDLIVWNARDKWDVLSNFDFNINQYELVLEKDGSYEIVEHCKDTGKLHMLRDLYKYVADPSDRVLHVCTIAEELGWDTCSVKNNLKLQMSAT